MNADSVHSAAPSGDASARKQDGLESGRSAVGHTPGPWKFHRWESDCWRVMGTTPDGLEGCYSVADVIDGNGFPQNAANAHLIAAAPELLDALRLGRQIGDGCSRGFLRLFYAAADAAIAKATGKQPSDNAQPTHCEPCQTGAEPSEQGPAYPSPYIHRSNP